MIYDIHVWYFSSRNCYRDMPQDAILHLLPGSIGIHSLITDKAKGY